MASTQKKAHTAAPDLKLLITTAAVAATLIGWGGLAARETVVPTSASPSALTIMVAELPVVATIVPPGFTTQNSTVVNAADVTSAPAMRRVVVAPAPVTVTRSSR
ncbi:MAG: hypothetical protein H7Z42_00710 [Roseiflexaceae bacterium]|nr:hypothetical protein [Roseiflexaceae bacterium]